MGLKNHTRGVVADQRSRALLWANASLAHQFFIEWLENSEGLARKMAGIMPLSTFDLTSMQRLASDTRGFTFLWSGFMHCCARDIMRGVCRSNGDSSFNGPESNFDTSLLKRVPISPF